MHSMKNLDIPIKSPRQFVPEAIDFDNWSQIKELLENLSTRKLVSKEDLLQWLLDRSELNAVMSESIGRRYIAMTIDTREEKHAKHYEYFVTEINPKIAPYDDLLNKKLADSKFISQLDEEGNGYAIYLKGVKEAIDLYREENNALFAKNAQLAQQYGSLSGKQSIVYQGEEITMQKAATFLKSNDRETRKMVFDLITERREKDQTAMNTILSDMINIRSEIAKNADFGNYVDYKFKSMGRFDYSVQDCLDFHRSIEEGVVPVVTAFQKERKESLGYTSLKPYDLDVPLDGKPPLQPFSTGEELLEKTTTLFYEIDDYCGERLAIMKEMGHLDLESKPGKAPGGYNYPLYEIGVPFIFMNAVGLHRDLTTMIHEGGHAVHSFLSRDLQLTAFKSLPSEVAELASMSMELIAMEHWEGIYNSEDLKKAKKEQLQGVLQVLPWIAIVDAFQHWLYTNPSHSTEERENSWLAITKRFSTGQTDWSDYPSFQRITWQKQLHIFEVPFYYIEYGLAQLGAIAIWRNYRANPEKTMQQYKTALALGYTQSIPEIYETAGIAFNFSSDYIGELANYVMDELKKL